MWLHSNGVESRKGIPPSVYLYKPTNISKTARICAMVVCLTTTWLVMSGTRYVFECDLDILPGDTSLYQFLYSDGGVKPNTSVSTFQPTLGERYVLRNWGCALLAKGILDLCVTFGGSPPFIFNVLTFYNILVVWSVFAASFLTGELPHSFNSENFTAVLLAVEAPCLYVLGGTNGVAEDDGEHHED